MTTKLFDSEDNFCKQLIYWYQDHQRDLPWRKTKDPYKIWLSEIILQQTKVDQGLSYYLKFESNYPTVLDLANAPLDQVLRDWQGLGYYSRARNLHAAAKVVVEDYKSVFPNSYLEIQKLKGVGEYTAAAIASFSFDLPHAVLDGNVYRVLSRYFGVETDISSSKAKKEFTALANKVLNQKDPASHNQAIMEFGALQCTPKRTDCSVCPLCETCYAFKANRVNELPVKLKKVKIKNRFLNYLIINKDEYLTLNQRGAGDVWQGLYQFPLIESTKMLSSEEVLHLYEKKVVSIKLKDEKKHVLSHQRINCRFWEVKLDDVSGYQFYNKGEVADLPKSVLINNYLTEFYF